MEGKKDIPIPVLLELMSMKPRCVMFFQLSCLIEEVVDHDVADKMNGISRFSFFQKIVQTAPAQDSAKLPLKRHQ